MRHASLLLPVVLALAAAGCARQQPAYYVTDSMTGQRVSTDQQNAPDGRRVPLAADGSHATGYNSYASKSPQRQESTGRGLFNSGVFNSNTFNLDNFGTSSPAPTSTYQVQVPRRYAPQTYSYQPPPQAYAQQPATMQYRPPQPVPRGYGPQRYYGRPQTRPASYYAERYGWY